MLLETIEMHDLMSKYDSFLTTLHKESLTHTRGKRKLISLLFLSFLKKPRPVFRQCGLAERGVYIGRADS